MQIFHSLLPLHNPLGFGAADLVELALAALLVAMYWALPLVQPHLQKLAFAYGLVRRGARGSSHRAQAGTGAALLPFLRQLARMTSATYSWPIQRRTFA